MLLKFFLAGYFGGTLVVGLSFYKNISIPVGVSCNLVQKYDVADVEENDKDIERYQYFFKELSFISVLPLQ